MCCGDNVLWKDALGALVGSLLLFADRAHTHLYNDNNFMVSHSNTPQNTVDIFVALTCTTPPQGYPLILTITWMNACSKEHCECHVITCAPTPKLSGVPK